MNNNPQPKHPKVSLLVADVDGTLVTKEKVLTSRARNAVWHLHDAGIAFTITSGRPPLGMKMLIDALELTAPIAAFNGAVLLRPDFSIIDQNLLPKTVALRVVEIIDDHGLDVWVYSDRDWFVHERHGPHVDREQRTVKFSPTVVPSFEQLLDKVAKIVVADADDLDAVARCEADTQREFQEQISCKAGASSGGGEQVCAARSQPYYLDVTHPRANKGAVVSRLSSLLTIPTQEIATIGDMPNDVPMFERSERPQYRDGQRKCRGAARCPICDDRLRVRGLRQRGRTLHFVVWRKKMNKRVQEILHWYSSDNPGTLTNLARLLNQLNTIMEIYGGQVAHARTPVLT